MISLKIKYLFFKIKHTCLQLLYILLLKISDVKSASHDLFVECNSKHVYLRPSEIKYSQGSIPQIVYRTSEGYQETLLEVLDHAIKRKKSVPGIVSNLTVVNRPDRRGPYYDPKTWNDPRKSPGWWAVEGNGWLWVLKVMEELKLIETIKVRCLEAVSEDYWNAICSNCVLNEGWSLVVVGSSPVQFEKDKKLVIKQWRKSAAPTWSHVNPAATDDLQGLSLCNYDSSALPRLHMSCSGYGVCHSKLNDPQSIGVESHKCFRKYKSALRIKTPRHTPLFTELLDWALYLRVFLALTIVFCFLFCALKGCGKVFGTKISPETNTEE